MPARGVPPDIIGEGEVSWNERTTMCKGKGRLRRTSMWLACAFESCQNEWARAWLILQNYQTPVSPKDLIWYAWVSFIPLFSGSVFRRSKKLLQSFFLILGAPGMWANISLNQLADLPSRSHVESQSFENLPIVSVLNRVLLWQLLWAWFLPDFLASR